MATLDKLTALPSVFRTGSYGILFARQLLRSA